MEMKKREKKFKNNNFTLFGFVTRPEQYELKMRILTNSILCYRFDIELLCSLRKSHQRQRDWMRKKTECEQFVDRSSHCAHPIAASGRGEFDSDQISNERTEWNEKKMKRKHRNMEHFLVTYGMRTEPPSTHHPSAHINRTETRHINHLIWQ